MNTLSCTSSSIRKSIRVYVAHANYLLLFAVASVLMACGGGGATNATSPVQTLTFPIGTAIKNLVTNGYSVAVTLNGNIGGALITGSGTTSSVAPWLTTFEGQPALETADNVDLITTSNGTTQPLQSTSHQYFDPSTYALLGMNDSDGNYYVVTSFSGWPTAAKIGDSGTLATIAIYKDASKSSVIGNASFGYTIEADGMNSAILELTTIETDNANKVVSKSYDRYRITADGTASFVSSRSVMTDTNGNADMTVTSSSTAPSINASNWLDSNVVRYDTHGHSLAKLRIADINRDGLNDVIAITGNEYPGQELQIYYQDKDGTLSKFERYTTNDVLDNVMTINGVGVGDVNSDGYPEILLAVKLKLVLSGSPERLLVLHYDQTTHSLVETQRLTIWDPYFSEGSGGDITVADVNGDGRLDAIVLAGRPIAIFYQSTSGQLTDAIINNIVYRGGAAITDYQLIQSNDYNADGRTDVVVQTGDLELTVLKQTASGDLANPTTYPVITQYWPNFSAYASGDINGDKRADIVVIDPASPWLNLFVQDQSGNLVKQVASIPNGMSPCSIQIADIDGDGRNDIVGDYTSGGLQPKKGVVIYSQDDKGQFSKVRTFETNSSSFGACQTNQTVAVGDVTGDSKPDVVTTWGRDGMFVFKHSK